MAVLDQLEPQSVFHFFEELSAIPHGSGNTGAVSDWCVAFARERGLEVHQDELHNVIIIKEATPGHEAAEPLILQGHLDMVCEKTADCTKDMSREGLDLVVDGDTVYAKGTTLGGDDGIAVAIALALLDDDTLVHPRLEAVFTTEEEVGMEGVQGLDVTLLKGRTLLNLDSEEEGVFTVSCAGGSRAHCGLPLTRAPYAGTRLRVAVSGLTGGHSGSEINKGRANANMLLGRLLEAAAAAGEMRLVSAQGGMKDNAIPVAVEAVVAVADAGAVRTAVEQFGESLKHEYHVTEPALTIAVTEAAEEEVPMDQASTDRALCLLSCVPNGIQAMSMDLPGLVQTSLNLGVLRTEASVMTATFCVRSSVSSQKEMLHSRLKRLMNQLGGTLRITGDYPAWEYRTDSPLRERMVELFREQYGKEPRVEAIHAGLECGILSGKLPGLDCVSIGPDLTEIHTPRERMHIASVQRVWRFITELVRRSA